MIEFTLHGNQCKPFSICFLGGLVLSLFFNVATAEPYPVMRPDAKDRDRWLRSYYSAPLVKIDLHLEAEKASVDLLNHLQYTPAEQLNCGNCWSWAGTGGDGNRFEL